MLKNMLKATVFATTMALATGAFYTPAFAEVVYNRGSAAEPESVDPHKTSTVYEANILRDLFRQTVAAVEHGEHYSLNGEARVKIVTHPFHRLQQLAQSLEREEFALERHQDCIRGRKCVYGTD